MRRKNQPLRRRSQGDHTTLPRFVLRGFVFREPSGKRRHNCVYVFTKEAQQGCSEHIQEVSVERDFFGRPGEREVETKLSRDETRFAPMVAELRGHDGPIPHDRVPLVAEFVTHFVRSAVVRYQIARHAEHISTIVADEVTNPELLDRVLEEVQRELPTPLRALLDRLSPEQRVLALENGRRLGRLRGEEKAAQLSRGFRDLRHFGFDHEMVRELHLDQIDGDFASYGLAQHLGTWSWAVIAAPPSSFIIGDVGPVAALDGLSELHPLISASRPAQPLAAFLPIAHDRLLVGWRSGTQPPIDIDGLNIAAAELSRASFIARDANARERPYVDRIGARFAEPDLEKLLAAFRARSTQLREEERLGDP